MQGSSVGAPEAGRDSALAGHNPANGVPTGSVAKFFSLSDNLQILVIGRIDD